MDIRCNWDLSMRANPCYDLIFAGDKSGGGGVCQVQQSLRPAPVWVRSIIPKVASNSTYSHCPIFRAALGMWLLAHTCTMGEGIQTWATYLHESPAQCSSLQSLIKHRQPHPKKKIEDESLYSASKSSPPDNKSPSNCIRSPALSRLLLFLHQISIQDQEGIRSSKVWLQTLQKKEE